MGRGISSVPVQTSDRAPRVDQVLDIFNFPAGVWTNIRFFPTAIENECIVASHWMEVYNEEGQKNRFSKQCIGFDRQEAKVHPENCPYCTHINQPRLEYFENVIVREIQENEPARQPAWTAKEENTWFKDKDSKSWTPVRVVRLTAALVGKIQKFVSLMKAAPEDVENGYDISIYYDPKAKAAGDKYQVQCGARTPLQEHEWNTEYGACAYLIHNVGAAYPEHESWDRAEAEVNRIWDNLVEEEPKLTGSKGGNGSGGGGGKGGKGARQAQQDDDGGYGGGDLDAGGDDGYDAGGDGGEDAYAARPAKGGKGAKGAKGGYAAPAEDDDYTPPPARPAAKGGKGAKGAARPAPDFESDVASAEASFAPPAAKGGKGAKGAKGGYAAPAEPADDDDYIAPRPAKGGKGAKGGARFGGEF